MLSERASCRLPVPASAIAIDAWLFSLSDGAYRDAAKAHLGAGTFRAPDGRRGFFDAEGFAGAFIVNHHLEEEARSDYVRVRSRDSRAWLLRLIPLQLEVCWEMAVRPAGSTACEVECRLGIALPYRALELLARALGVPALHRRHNQEQLHGFAASILAGAARPA